MEIYTRTRVEMYRNQQYFLKISPKYVVDHVHTLPIPRKTALLTSMNVPLRSRGNYILAQLDHLPFSERLMRSQLLMSFR